MATPRIRKTKTESEYESVIDDFYTQGYEAIERGESSTMMEKSSWGSGVAHLVILLFLGWWTLGVANLIYAVFVKYAKSKKVMVKLVKDFS